MQTEVTMMMLEMAKKFCDFSKLVVKSKPTVLIAPQNFGQIYDLIKDPNFTVFMHSTGSRKLHQAFDIGTCGLQEWLMEAAEAVK